jgi:transcriptional regulator with XRE-family HTH domain
MLLLVDIAEEIAKQRKAAGLSRAELAKRALVSRSTLEALENGRIGEARLANDPSAVLIMRMIVLNMRTTGRGTTSSDLLRRIRERT